MSAPKGNNFWEIRSTHGRDTLFESPEKLWEAALEYFQWSDEHPLMQAKAHVVSKGSGEGSEVELHETPLKRVYSLGGLCLYLGCSSSYFRTFKSTVKLSKKPVDYVQGILSVISEIEETIRTQQLEGASSGQFNANIIARTLGLIDKQDVTSGDKPISTNMTIKVVQPKKDD